MDSIISLRAFALDDPTEAESCGLLGETADGKWEYGHDCSSDRFGAAVEQYIADELDAIDQHQPASQRVYGGVAVVLDELVFRVVDDGIECEYRLSNGADLADGQTICNARNDADLGGTAERRHDDLRIADAVQRTSDALNHRIGWLNVISPRSLGGIVEAAADLVDDGGDGE